MTTPVTPTRIYFVKMPYFSKSLKVVYNKKLTVFSASNRAPNYYKIESTFEYKKSKWEEKPKSPPKHTVRVEIIYTDLQIFKSTDPVHYTSQYFAFDTLELAQAAKILFLEILRDNHQKKVKGITDDFERALPDTSEPLAELKLKIPEYFL